MKNFIKAAFATVFAATMATAVGAADLSKAKTGKDSWLKVGTLTCHVDPSIGLILGSHKEANCIYKGINGRKVLYTADLTRIGIDVGITDAQTIVWAVIAPGTKSPHSLVGTYVGASAELTALVGATANVLVGGMNQSIALQPVSVGAQTGLNVALGAASVTLHRAN